MTRILIYLVLRQGRPVVGVLATQLLALFGLEIPKSVSVGPRLVLAHRAFGTVLHPSARLGAHVTLYQNVTVGRADSWVPLGVRSFPGIVLGDHVVVCPGARILAHCGELLSVGEGTVIGANAVLTQSTGEWELWAGSPARRVGFRSDRTGA